MGGGGVGVKARNIVGILDPYFLDQHFLDNFGHLNHTRCPQQSAQNIFFMSHSILLGALWCNGSCF